MTAPEARLLSDVLGAEILGQDLREPVDDASVAALREALWKYRVLLFRDQELGPEDHFRVGSMFGEVNQQGAARRYGKVHYVSNVLPKGQLGTSEILLHTDQCFFERPQRVLMLYAMEVPARGGETLFLDAARAYETLPQRLKDRIEGLAAMHAFHYSADRRRDVRMRAGDIETEAAEDAPRAIHPVVMRHPETGERLLYVNENMTDSIVGFEPAESDALLAELFAHVRAQPTYMHAWRPHDLIVWDNLGTQHARTEFDPAQRRTLQRSQMY